MQRLWHLPLAAASALDVSSKQLASMPPLEAGGCRPTCGQRNQNSNGEPETDPTCRSWLLLIDSSLLKCTAADVCVCGYRGWVGV